MGCGSWRGEKGLAGSRSRLRPLQQRLLLAGGSTCGGCCHLEGGCGHRAIESRGRCRG